MEKGGTIMSDKIIQYINDLKNKELINGKIIHHQLIYCRAIDDLATLIYGKDSATKLLNEIKEAYNKELKRRF